MTASLPDADGVLALAREKTSLKEIDSDSWRDGLEVVLAAAAQPNVTHGGRQIILGRAVDALANRLRVHAYIQEHPEVLDQKIERPLFIMGQPRTGTTVVSYLLDQDPRRRSLLNWEAVDSAPPATTRTLRTDPRCLAALTQQKRMLDFLLKAKIVPSHWEDADGPTECMFVLQQDFKGLIWDSLTSGTLYADWLLAQSDVDSAYEYEKRVLQVLQSKAPGAWTLKMPSHAVHIESLLKVFPDARLLWTHRDPYRATASHCNLLKLPATMTLTEVDMATIGQNSKTQMREHVTRPLKAGLTKEQLYNMHYADVMRDPMSEIRGLYEWLGEDFTADVEQRMTRWLDSNRQHKLGVSKYSLAEYSLTKEELEPMFEEYLNAFDVQLEGET